jgi:hypothetical protein
MYGNSWADRLNGRQRTVYSFATAIALLIASTMFFSITTVNEVGVPYECGPAAYALLAGPDDEDPERGDCQTAARQRLTTVSGLILLIIIGSHIGSRLSRTPPVIRAREPSVTIAEPGAVVDGTRRAGVSQDTTITGYQRTPASGRPFRWR